MTSDRWNRRADGIWPLTLSILMPPPALLFSILVQSHGVSPISDLSTLILIPFWNGSLLLWCRWYPYSFWRQSSGSYISLACVLIAVLTWLVFLALEICIATSPMSLTMMSISLALVIAAVLCFATSSDRMNVNVGQKSRCPSDQN